MTDSWPFYQLRRGRRIETIKAVVITALSASFGWWMGWTDDPVTPIGFAALAAWFAYRRGADTVREMWTMHEWSKEEKL